MSYFCKGDILRGEEVIKLLEKFGGKNKDNLNGANENGYYYLTNDKIIRFIVTAESQLLTSTNEELYLTGIHEDTIIKTGDHVKVYFPNGPRYGIVTKYYDHIYTANEFDTSQSFIFDTNDIVEHYKWEPKFQVRDYVRHVDFFNEPAYVVAINYKEANYTIAKVNNKKTLLYDIDENKLIPWIPKRGELVLVRDYQKDCPWREGIFSFRQKHNIDNKYTYFVQGGNTWNLCAPFDEDKLGEE